MDLHHFFSFPHLKYRARTNYLSADKLFFPDHMWTNCWRVKKPFHWCVQNMRPPLPKSTSNTSNICHRHRRHLRRCSRRHDGVTRRFLKGVDGELAGYDTTWPATQVGPRPVEACLGGQDDGASVVDEGVETPSLQISKLGRLAMSDRPTFSGFCGQVNDFRSENKLTETFLPNAR